MSQEVRFFKGTRVVVIAAALVIVIAGIKAAETIVVPFVLAIFVAILFAAPTAWLQKKGVSRGVAVLIILVVLLAITALFFGFAHSPSKPGSAS